MAIALGTGSGELRAKRALAKVRMKSVWSCILIIRSG